MQQDVINHYQYSLYHYFRLDLNEKFLQNSSLGTPYQKWKKFTNDDFELLFFSIKTLISFTSRLWHESEEKFRVSNMDLDYLKKDSNRYTNLLCDLNNQNIGININDNNTLHLSSIALDGVKLDNGRWSSIKTKAIDIADRSTIKNLITKAEIEIEALINLKNEYSNRCKSYISTHDVLQEFDNLHASYWV